MIVRSSQHSVFHQVPVYRTEFTKTKFTKSDASNRVFRVGDIQPASSQRQRVREKLLEVLVTLDISQFERCIALLLHALEYDGVKIMRSPDLKRHSHKGRNAHGGFDLAACSSSFSSCLTLIQVKQYRRPVSRRFVDELRGAMLRHGAQQGLLITTSTFPTNAQFSAHENQLLRIRLIDGEQLVDLLFQHHLGVRYKERTNKSGKSRFVWRLDRKFFRNLQKMTL